VSLEALATRLRRAVLAREPLVLEGLGKVVPTTVGQVKLAIFRTDPRFKVALLGGEVCELGPEVAELATRLLGGDRVELHGTGSFEVKGRKAHVGVDPRTGERREVPEARLVMFKLAPELKAALNRAPDPLATLGELRLDRHHARNLVVTPPPLAAAGADLEQAVADPRFASVRRVWIRGATDGDAALVAAQAAQLEAVSLLDGGLSDAGAEALAGVAWPQLVELEVSGNRIGHDCLAALGGLVGFDPGVQRSPFGTSALFSEQFALPWDVLDPLLDGWGERLMKGVSEVLERVGDAALPSVVPELVPDRRWPSLPGPDLRVRWPGWARLLRAVRATDPTAQRVLDVARQAIDRCIEGALEGAFGNDCWWACDLGEAVAAVEGTLRRWPASAVPAVAPDPEILAALSDEVEVLRG